MASFFIRPPHRRDCDRDPYRYRWRNRDCALPIAQFPNIAPPEIWLQANYPGADAKTLEQSVATPIEQQVTGVDNMEYMYSVNTTNGRKPLYSSI